MSLLDHLDELRTRIIIVLATLTLCMVGGFFIAKPLVSKLTGPISKVKVSDSDLEIAIGEDNSLQLLGDVEEIKAAIADGQKLGLKFYLPPFNEDGRSDTFVTFGDEQKNKLHYSSPLDPVFIQFRVAFLFGLALSLPLILRQVWLFIKPGLTPVERKVIGPMLSWALVLFPAGGLFAFVVVTLLLQVMLNIQLDNVAPVLFFDKYIKLLTTFILAFGIVFELPLVVAICARLGVITPDMLTFYRRHIWVALAVAAMLLTPAEPTSMILVYIPMVLLFEISVFIAKPMFKAYKKSLVIEDEAGEDTNPITPEAKPSDHEDDEI